MKAKRIRRSLISMIMSMVLIIGMVPASAITALASEDEAEEVLLDEVDGDAAEVLTDDTQDTDVSVTSEDAASAPGEYPPDFEADAEGNIKTVSVFHPYMSVGAYFDKIYK